MKIHFIFLCFILLGLITMPGLASAQADDDLNQRVQQLEQKIEELQNELEILKAEISDRPVEPSKNEPDDSETLQAQSIQPTGNEKLLPDISVIVDTVGTVSSKSGVEENRDHLLIRGIELGIQGYLYPQIKGDVFIVAEGEDLSVSVEEAYASFLQIGQTGLTANVGKKFVDFGKINSVHREKWPYVTQPFVVRNLLNPDEGLTGQGAQVNYLLPLKGDIFGQASFGIWKPSAHHHEHDHEDEESPELGLGVQNRLYTGRLWLSKAVGGSAEAELGFSTAGGKGEEELGFPRTRLYGLDLTYRVWLEQNRRILLQAEAMRQKRSLPGEDGSRDGYYLLGTYKLDNYNDIGLRYDWAQLPAPELGHDSGLSAFYTRRLTETSYVRLQATRGSDANAGNYTSAFLQFVWGLGPHAHDLQ